MLTFGVVPKNIHNYLETVLPFALQDQPFLRYWGLAPPSCQDRAGGPVSGASTHLCCCGAKQPWSLVKTWAWLYLTKTGKFQFYIISQIWILCVIKSCFLYSPTIKRHFLLWAIQQSADWIWPSGLGLPDPQYSNQIIPNSLTQKQIWESSCLLQKQILKRLQKCKAMLPFS